MLHQRRNFTSINFCRMCGLAFILRPPASREAFVGMPDLSVLLRFWLSRLGAQALYMEDLKVRERIGEGFESRRS